MSDLVLGIPSKGRLQEQTLAFFADCGAAIGQDAGSRGYVARMDSFAEIEVRLLSASDVASQVASGAIHAGVTGEDLLRELGEGFARVILARPLGFGRADLIVAVPAAWLDVSSMADLDAVSAEHRARTGRRLRVATKYVRQAHAFFETRGVDDYRIVENAGATEGAPAAGAAEAIVDITTTGATLAANGLKRLTDGLILRSEAQLTASRAASWSDAARDEFGRLLDQIEARARGKAHRLVRVALGGADQAGVRAVVDRAGGEAPDASWEGGQLLFYCPAAGVSSACAELNALGVGTVAVVNADYVFRGPSAVRKRFEDALNNG